MMCGRFLGMNGTAALIRRLNGRLEDGFRYGICVGNSGQRHHKPDGYDTLNAVCGGLLDVETSVSKSIDDFDCIDAAHVNSLDSVDIYNGKVAYLHCHLPIQKRKFDAISKAGQLILSCRTFAELLGTRLRSVMVCAPSEAAA